MEKQIENIVQTFSKPRNQTEVLLRLFHQNRLTDNVKQKESIMCSKCLTPWIYGKFHLSMKPSNSKRRMRRNHRIERLQAQLKSKQATNETDTKTLGRKIKKLQQQNNHVALYKCFCKNKTIVQLKKKNKSENVTSALNMNEERKHKTQHDDSNPKKVKTKKKKKKTAGLLIPTSKAAIKIDETSLSSTQKSFSKISAMFKQQKHIDETKKQQSKLNQFFK